jgi:3-methylfumaryl-CoA hydratase
MDALRLQEWIGRTETRTARIAAAPLVAMSATLDRDDPEPGAGTEVPPLWHWLYFTPTAKQSDLGPDGHFKRGAFVPPIPLPRRMFAGARVTFHAPLRIDEEVQRVSRIESVETKTGRTGTLAFLKMRHELSNAAGVCLVEEQDIVFREPPRADAPPPAATPAPADHQFSREIVPDPVLLFRYSALTFNSHRIHYDRDYATGVEGYPGLVVHGPFIATLLADLLRRQRPDARLRRFEFKAVRPLFDLHSFATCGRESEAGRFDLWARDHEGNLCMRASAGIG